MLHASVLKILLLLITTIRFTVYYREMVVSSEFKQNIEKTNLIFSSDALRHAFVNELISKTNIVGLDSSVKPSSALFRSYVHWSLIRHTSLFYLYMNWCFYRYLFIHFVIYWELSLASNNTTLWSDVQVVILF